MCFVPDHTTAGGRESVGKVKRAKQRFTEKLSLATMVFFAPIKAHNMKRIHYGTTICDYRIKQQAFGVGIHTCCC